LDDSASFHPLRLAYRLLNCSVVGGPITTVELIERVVRLELQQAPLEVLAAEMLAPLLEALDARAGALLCYRRDEAALTLAAGRGLAAAAAEQLAMLRWGGGGAWEMPLRALVDRTVYHVSADAFRTVAAEPVGEDAASTIAAIPLHRWHQPVGVVLAIADGALDAERVLAHRLAYDVLALALAAALWGGARPSQVDVGASAPTLACAAWADIASRRFDARAGEGRHVDGAAIDAMLRDLRGAVDALRAERRLDEAERVALAERLAEAERDRSEHAARTAMLEDELARQAALLGDGRGEPGTAIPSATATATAAEARSDDTTAPDATQAPPTRAHRVLDADASRGEAIAAALASALPNPSPRGLVVANLLDATPTLLTDVMAAAREGATIVAYAAEGARSRILGGVRCFAEPPAPGEITAGLESQPRGGRRLISLSDDIDAFIPAKVELAKLGYSVSMACDEKQAIDLLALLNPDAVLVDVRKTPEAAAGFVDALSPEDGRVLTLLVHGDPQRGMLRRALERLMRPTPLDAGELARVCRTVVTNASAGTRPAAVSPLRPIDRVETAPRRAGARA
jgi:hypothetical protein